MGRRLLVAVLLSFIGLHTGCSDGSGPPESVGGNGGASSAQGPSTTATTSASTPTTTTSSDAGPTTAASTSGSGGAVSCTGLTGEAGDFDRTISFGGKDRRFLLHVPASYDPTAGTQLVVALHGFTEGPEDIRDTSHFDVVSDQRGFIVAYPEGLTGSWNGGACCGLSVVEGIDDVGFIGALLDTLEAEYCVDPARVFATGFSNGGFMSHKLGCELSDRIAAIGVVAGQESLAECNPTRPVPVLQIHGDADPVVPYGGNPLLGFPPTSSTITGWATRDGCNPDPSPAGDLGDTSCEIYGECSEGAAVELCTVSGGGHDWPGGGSAWTGDTPPDGFVATLAIADFFEAHPRP